MTKLKLGPLEDDKPVKLTIELPAAVFRDLKGYAEILTHSGGAAIAPMIKRFMTMIAYAFLHIVASHTRGRRKESTGLRLNQPCPPHVTPSSISSSGRRLTSASIAERKSLKSSGANTICQSSASHLERKFVTLVDGSNRFRGERLWGM